MHKIQVEQFEGPLDLLLQLIEKNKLQITEISLAKITDQYLDYIENNENLASDEVADFLLIASKLIYIKSKFLLPELASEDEEEVDLEHQLKIYRQYYEASRIVDKIFSDKNKRSYSPLASYKNILQEGFIAPKHVDVGILQEMFAGVLSKIERVVNLPKAVIAKAVSIGEKIKNIKDLIRNKTRLSFNELLKDKKNKMEVIVSFLAMLELVKQKEITVDQESLFSDLSINKNGE